MINIRKSLFETNSSSADSYSDDYPNHSYAMQKVHIGYTWKEDTTDERIDEICDAIYNGAINDTLMSIFSFYYEDMDKFEIISVDADGISFEAECTVEISWFGKYYPATRYEPADYPEPEIVDYDGVPTKDKEYPNMKSEINSLMKVFKENGWTEVESINYIYGDDLDESEVFDNISYD